MSDLRPLGRVVQHDPRSRAFAVQVNEAAPLKKVLWHRYGTVLNQGRLGSCTGNAIAGALNTAPFWKPGRTLTEKDAVVLYCAATHLDDVPGSYPPDDTGSSGLAVCKAAKVAGLISGYTHAFSLAQALQALMSGPVITGIDWHSGFDHPDANGVVTASGWVRGGHEFEVVGYDPATQLVTAINSWGRSWGPIAGRFKFTSVTWGQLLDAQGDVTVPVQL